MISKWASEAVAMTTNVEDEVPVTNGDVPCTDEVEQNGAEMTCDKCKELQEELQKHEKDKMFYASLKKKIALTDSLIRKYNNKCQEFDLQQKKLQEVTLEASSSKWDRKVLEDQLAVTLKEVIPWKRDKGKFQKELEACRAKLRDTEDKLEGSEASCVQFKNGFLEIQGRLEAVEAKHADLKKDAEKSQQAEKKASGLLAKCKDDLSTCRKDLKNAKKHESKLARQYERAQNTVSELVQLLRSHGIAVPKIPKALMNGSAHNQDKTSTEDTDFDPSEEMVSPSQGFLFSAKRGTPSKDPKRKEQNGSRPSQDDACLKIFDKFSSYDMSSCMSPLPPSPQPSPPEQEVEMMSDSNSDVSRDGESSDEAFSDMADQLESQLLSEGEGKKDASPKVKEEMAEEQSHLRQTPRRKAKTQNRSADVDAGLCSDSEEEAPGKPRLDRRSGRSSSKKGDPEMLPTRRKPEAVVAELHSDRESQTCSDLQASSHGDILANFDLQGERVKQRRLRERTATVGHESVSDPKGEVSGETPLRTGGYEQRRFKERQSAELSKMSSTLSEDSDESQDENTDSTRRLSLGQERKNSSMAELQASSSSVDRKPLSPSPRDLKKSQDEGSVSQKTLLLSPDRRMTRSQLRTLTKQGVIDPTDTAVPCATKPPNELKGKGHTDSASHMQDSPVGSSLHQEQASSQQTNTNNTPIKDQHAAKLAVEHLKPDTEGSPRRPVTRSLSLSESESSTEAAPHLPARAFPKRLLRSNSAPGQKPGPEGRPSESPLAVEVSVGVTETQQESSVFCGNDQKLSPRLSPRKLSRSVSVPGNGSSGAESSNSLEKLQNNMCNVDVSRRVTRSQTCTLKNPDIDETGLKRLTRSAAHNLALRTEAKLLPTRGNASTVSQQHSKSDSEVASSRKQKAKSVEKLETSQSSIGSGGLSAENAATLAKDACLELRDTHQELNSTAEELDNSRLESEQACLKGLTGSTSEGSSDGDNASLQHDTTSPCRRVTRSLSSLESKPHKAKNVSDSLPVLTAPVIGTSSQEHPENKKMVSCNGIQVAEHLEDNENELPENKEKGPKSDGLDQNGISTAPTEVHATQEPFCELLPETESSGDQKPVLKKSDVLGDKESQGDKLARMPAGTVSSGSPPVSRNGGGTSTMEQHGVGNQDGRADHCSSEKTDLPVAEYSSPGGCETCSDKQGSLNGSLIGEANSDNPHDRESSSSCEDSSIRDDVQMEELPLSSGTNSEILYHEPKRSTVKRPTWDEEDRKSAAAKKFKTSVHIPIEHGSDANREGAVIANSPSLLAVGEQTRETTEDKRIVPRSQPVIGSLEMGETANLGQVNRHSTAIELPSDSTEEGHAGSQIKDISGIRDGLANVTSVVAATESETSVLASAVISNERMSNINQQDSTGSSPSSAMSQAIGSKDKEEAGAQTAENAWAVQSERQNESVEQTSATGFAETAGGGRRLACSAVENQNEHGENVNLGISIEGKEHHAFSQDEDLASGSLVRAGNSDPSAPSGATLQPDNLSVQQDASTQRTSETSNRAAQHHIMCVEAESSRPSTPTVEEVISINSMSGQVSPVSPLPFPQYDPAGPLSPLSFPLHSPPLSPLAPSPLTCIFEAMISFPRMISSLPPSPGITDTESADEIGHLALTEVVSVSGVVGPPRVISPLFPTPVPPAVSPLLEAPMPNMISPFSDVSPVRPGHALDHNPVISPLRNPLIPSPCNFHAEAPRDALSVRPQHYPASRRQPAFRCLAASFTTTTAGVTQHPEIISPRLHSLASETAFEFRESQPNTTELHGQQVSSDSSSKMKTDQAKGITDDRGRPTNNEEQRQSSKKQGFRKCSESTKGKYNAKDSVANKQPETASQDALKGKDSLESQKLDDKEPMQLPKGISKDNQPSQSAQNYNPPRTRSRNTQSASQKTEPAESLHVPQSIQKEVRNTAAVSEAEKSAPSKRCTRSQAGSSSISTAESDLPGIKRSTSSRVSRKGGQAEKDSERTSKVADQKKKSRNPSSQTGSVEKDARSAVNEPRDALHVNKTGTFTPKIASTLPGKPGLPGAVPGSKRAVLIPALEHKISGFKRSGSLRRRQNEKQAVDRQEMSSEVEETQHSLTNQEITGGQQNVGNDDRSGTDNESRTMTGHSQVKVSEKDPHVGLAVRSKKQLGMSQKDQYICQKSPDQDRPKELAVGAVPMKNPSDLKVSSGETSLSVSDKQPILSPRMTSAAGSKQAALMTEIVHQNVDLETGQNAISKPSKAKSKIGSIWGDIASRPDRGIAIFNRGPRKKKKKQKQQPQQQPQQQLQQQQPQQQQQLQLQLQLQQQPQQQPQLQQPQQQQHSEIEKWDPSQPLWISVETDSTSSQKSKQGGTENGVHSQAHEGESEDTTQAVLVPSALASNAQPHQKQAIKFQPANSTHSESTQMDKALSQAGMPFPSGEPNATQTLVGGVSATEPRVARSSAHHQDTTRLSTINMSISKGGQQTKETNPEDCAVVSDTRQGASASVHWPESGVRNVSTHGTGTTGRPSLKEQKRLELTGKGVNPDSRKRHLSRDSNSTTDSIEPPAPHKQPKMTTGQMSTTERSEVQHPMSEVTVPMSEIRPPVQTFHEPVLDDLLQRIKALRSKSNAKPLFAAILTYVGQQAINLMPAIQAKCLARNTSTKPLLLPHEEQLVSCLIESGLPAKKSNMGMLLACLCRGVQNPPPSTSTKPAVTVSAAYCRILSALSRQAGLMNRVRVFCYDLVREGLPSAEEMLLNIAVTWPDVLSQTEGVVASPVCSAIEIVTMQRLVLSASPQNLQAQEIIKCFIAICGWKIPEGNVPAVRCRQLVTSIQDTNITKLCNTGTPTQALTAKSYEIVKALELLACHMGWEWINDYLIRNLLWPVLKKWSQEIQAAKATEAAGGGTGLSQSKPPGSGTSRCMESPADASACAVMKVIGGLAGLGMSSNRQSVYELLKMLSAVLKQPSACVPWTVQVYTAEAILHLAPSDPTFALEVIQQWRQRVPVVPPARIGDKMRVLAKVAGAINGGASK